MTPATIAANLVGISRKKELNHQESELLKQAARKIHAMQKHVNQLLQEIAELNERNANLEERLGIMMEDEYVAEDEEVFGL